MRIARIRGLGRVQRVTGRLTGRTSSLFLAARRHDENDITLGVVNVLRNAATRSGSDDEFVKAISSGPPNMRTGFEDLKGINDF